MSDFIAALFMILVFAGTWFTLFYVGGASWLAEASVLRAKYQMSGAAQGADFAPHAAAKSTSSQAARPAPSARLMPA